MNFKEQLEDYWLDQQGQECSPSCKLSFLGEYIFDFTTYDDEVDKYLAEKMIEVLQCILDRTTFKYQEQNNINYLVMVNMPFLKNRLDWGGSIRGAWFDYDAHEISGIKIPQGQLSEFISQLLEWINSSPLKLPSPPEE